MAQCKKCDGKGGWCGAGDSPDECGMLEESDEGDCAAICADWIFCTCKKGIDSQI